MHNGYPTHVSKNLSTQTKEARKRTWFPLTIKSEFRACRYQKSAQEREEKNYGLKHMFPRRKRLQKRDFPTALAEGRAIFSHNFKIIIPSTKKGYAVIVPKRLSSSSVARHHIKRQVLWALRTIPTLPTSAIFFPKQTVMGKKQHEIAIEISEALSHNTFKQ